MPELPEVEHFKRSFNRVALHKKIAHVACSDARVLKGAALVTINRLLKGKQFAAAERRGKFLIAPVTGTDKKVVFHFGLSGYFVFLKKKDTHRDPYAKVTVLFANGDALQWINKRNLGRVYVVSDLNKIATLKTMGPEPLQLSLHAFQALLASHASVAVKSFLMQQQYLAGIGNNYANEICFQAGIYPGKKGGSLTAVQIKKLYHTMKKVLKEALTLPIDERKEQFPRHWLLAHKRDHICPKNRAHRLKTMTLGGRTTIYCPEHQQK